MAGTISVIQGEASTERTKAIKDVDGAVVDVSTATCTFVVVSNDKLDTNLFTVADGSFDKSAGASGILSFPISSTNSNQKAAPGGKAVYKGELKVLISASNIKKTFVDFIVENTRDTAN